MFVYQGGMISQLDISVANTGCRLQFGDQTIAADLSVVGQLLINTTYRKTTYHLIVEVGFYREACVFSKRLG